MTSIERVRAALQGKAVDRPPFTIWYHFGLQHAPAERTAQAHLEFFDAYHLDWLKMMNDYSYPMPDGVETLGEARDLGRLQPFDPTRGPMGEQLRAVQILAAALRGRALFVDTVFNAWNTLRRNVVKDAMDALMRIAKAGGHARRGEREPTRYFGQPRARRGHIFFSVPATQSTPEQYRLHAPSTWRCSRPSGRRVPSCPARGSTSIGCSTAVHAISWAQVETDARPQASASPR
jgi:hypothetical protein